MSEIFADNRQLRHTTPCSDCPFKRVSAPGWLGGYPVATYAEPVEAGLPTSCHKRDYGCADPRTSLCAGALALLANTGQPALLEQHRPSVEQVGSREEVFTSSREFREHHARADSLAYKFT